MFVHDLDFAPTISEAPPPPRLSPPIEDLKTGGSFDENEKGLSPESVEEDEGLVGVMGDSDKDREFLFGR